MDEVKTEIKMVRLKNDDQLFENGAFMQSFLKDKEPDCILYSKDGIKFNIHKEILYQSKLFRDISIFGHVGCCKSIEIFSPCSENELESILNFLYDGTISFDTETKVAMVLDNLARRGRSLNLKIAFVEQCIPPSQSRQ